MVGQTVGCIGGLAAGSGANRRVSPIETAPKSAGARMVQAPATLCDPQVQLKPDASR